MQKHWIGLNKDNVTNGELGNVWCLLCFKVQYVGLRIGILSNLHSRITRSPEENR